MSASQIKPQKKLPIKPTDKPSPQAIAVVATSVINTVQKSILSPAAVIATLRCAFDLYTKNAIAIGFDPEAAAECEKLGAQLAEALKASGAVKSRSPIVAPDTSLVAPDGTPLAGTTLAETVAAVRAQAEQPTSGPVTQVTVGSEQWEPAPEQIDALVSALKTEDATHSSDSEAGAETADGA